MDSFWSGDIVTPRKDPPLWTSGFSLSSIATLVEARLYGNCSKKSCRHFLRVSRWRWWRMNWVTRTAPSWRWRWRWRRTKKLRTYDWNLVNPVHAHLPCVLKSMPVYYNVYISVSTPTPSLLLFLWISWTWESGSGGGHVGPTWQVLCCAVLCCAVLCCGLCCAVLCCAARVTNVTLWKVNFIDIISHAV
jgi:hypothetical protein